MLELHRRTDSIPALLRAGGILPLAAEDDLDATRNPERLELLVAPGADGELTLIEDDETAAVARTAIIWRQAAGELTIGAPDDPDGVLAGSRTWTVRFLGVDHEPARIDGSGTVTIGPDPQPRTPALEEAVFAVLNGAQFGHEDKAAAWRTITSGRPGAAILAELHAQGLPRELIGALAELLTARG